MSSRLSTLDPQSVEVVRAFSDCLRLDLPESVAAAIVEVPAVVAAMFAKQLEVDHSLGDGPSERNSNIWQPVDEGTGASGGWRTTREGW